VRPLVVVLLACLGRTAAAAEAVLEVTDATTLRLESGPARLAALHVPHAEPARRALAALVDGRRLDALGTPARDRHGRLLAQFARDDGLWLQGELVRRGLAMVWTRADARERAAELLAIEAEARAAGRGLWADRPVRTAETVRPNRFAVVEGTVAETARVRGRVYVNFGADWRTDLTVAIAAADLPAFKAAGLDPLKLKGRRVRVRGWLEDYNGPYLEADHPEMIEVLDAAPEPEKKKARKRKFDEAPSPAGGTGPG
jgi:micrococcal nuclease